MHEIAAFHTVNTEDTALQRHAAVGMDGTSYLWTTSGEWWKAQLPGALAPDTVWETKN